ncbi:hypothetical protein ACR77J_07655 [Tissierella praeacuta]|uniref:hypothetical protein n=1 Tax=Tissierella praeacuta TaxID=43131 RepID=UPI003DA20A9C
MNRDIEILCEIIADNIDLLKKDGDFDIGIYEDVCYKLGFDWVEYIEGMRNIPGRFKS